MRSFPFCGVRVLHPVLLDNHPGDRQKTNKQKIPWLSISRSDWHVLQRRCQPTPTPIYIWCFSASVPTEANYYIYTYSGGQAWGGTHVLLALVIRPILSRRNNLSGLFTAHVPARGPGQVALQKLAGRLGSEGLQVSRVGPGNPDTIRPVKNRGINHTAVKWCTHFKLDHHVTN